ncbi:MAG: hypothetical protein NT027_17525 [Proteobacteria bacterium]|nr:hypothetical protein [Pseudomonadota bacterium]
MSKLGQLLVREGRLTESDRKMIRRESGSFRGSYARSILALGVMTDQELATFIASKTAFKKIATNLNAEVDQDVVHLIPGPLLKWLDVLPLKKAHGTLKVAMVDPTDREVITQLEFFSGLKVMPVVAPISLIKKALQDFLPSIPNFEPGEFEEFIGSHSPKVAKMISRDSRSHSGDAPEQTLSGLDVVEGNSTMTDDSGGEVMGDEFPAEPITDFANQSDNGGLVNSIGEMSQETDFSQNQEGSSADANTDDDLFGDVVSQTTAVDTDALVSDVLSKSTPSASTSSNLLATSSLEKKAEKKDGIDLEEWEAAINGSSDSSPSSPVVESPEAKLEASANDFDSIDSLMGAEEASGGSAGIQKQDLELTDSDLSIDGAIASGDSPSENILTESSVVAEATEQKEDFESLNANQATPPDVDLLETMGETPSAEESTMPLDLLNHEATDLVNEDHPPEMMLETPGLSRPSVKIDPVKSQHGFRPSATVAIINRALVKMTMTSDLTAASKIVGETSNALGGRNGAVFAIDEGRFSGGCLWVASGTTVQYTTDILASIDLDLISTIDLCMMDLEGWQDIDVLSQEKKAELNRVFHATNDVLKLVYLFRSESRKVLLVVDAGFMRSDEIKSSFVEILRALAFKC